MIVRGRAELCASDGAGVLRIEARRVKAALLVGARSFM